MFYTIPAVICQISAYIDNEFDVASLMEDAETKQVCILRLQSFLFSENQPNEVKTDQAALEQVADLEEELGRVSEQLAETEQEAMSQQVNDREMHILQ